MKGKLLWLDIDNALTVDGIVDIRLLPAVDTNGIPCLVDMKWRSGSHRPYAFYNARGNDIEVGTQTNTATVIVAERIVQTAVLPVCYETNVVGAADNKLIVDDAA